MTRVFNCLLKKELKSYFYSPLAYTVLFFFWILSGLNFYWILLQLADGEQFSEITQMLFCGPLVIFSLPVISSLITMKLFSEEAKMGTLEMTLTTPISDLHLIFSKYLSAFIFYLILWVPYIIYINILNSLFLPLEEEVFNIGIFISSFIGIICIGLFYISVGILMSAITSNQIIASVSSFGILFGSLIFFMFMGINTYDMSLRLIGKYFSTFDHFIGFSRGIIDTRILIFYFIHSIWIIFSIIKIIEWKRN